MISCSSAFSKTGHPYQIESENLDNIGNSQKLGSWRDGLKISFGLGNKAEIDVFLDLSCFFNDRADVGNLISGSSAFAKTSLNIWKFMVQVLLKPGLENFEHY